MAAELVRPKAGEVRGQLGAPFNPRRAWGAQGGGGASLGHTGRRAGLRGQCGAGGPEALRPDGAALFRGKRGRRKWGAGVGEANARVLGASPLPSGGLGEVGDLLAGPAASRAPVIEGALTRFTPRNEPTGTRRLHLRGLWAPFASGAPPKEHSNVRFCAARKQSALQ